MDDIRYSELLFLRGVERGEIQSCIYDSIHPNTLNLDSRETCLEMALAALEDLHIRIDNSNLKHLVLKLRGELPDA